MVGTPPAGGASSTVPVTITPINLVLADGAYAYPSGAVPKTASSALFRPSTFKSGVTQYGDAVQRAEFWTKLSSTYHVLLGAPQVQPLLTLNVPAGYGSEMYAADGRQYLAVDIAWIDGQLRALAATAPANTFPIFLAYETYLYQGSGIASIGGYHSAVSNGTGIHTYGYASWVTPDAFGPSSANLAALSHEVAEWLNDPYVNNAVPHWSVPSLPQYGCNASLEVGDPLVGTVFNVGGLNFQDEAFLSWFAHQQPSIALNGNYSLRGTFKQPAALC